MLFPHLLFLKRSKCLFAQPQVSYLWHIISVHRVAVEDLKRTKRQLAKTIYLLDTEGFSQSLGIKGSFLGQWCNCGSTSSPRVHGVIGGP